MERECVEERCTKEEAREVFENDPETVSMCRTKSCSLFPAVKGACSFRADIKHTTPPDPQINKHIKE